MAVKKGDKLDPQKIAEMKKVRERIERKLDEKLSTLRKDISKEIDAALAHSEAMHF